MPRIVCKIGTVEKVEIKKITTETVVLVRLADLDNISNCSRPVANSP